MAIFLKEHLVKEKQELQEFFDRLMKVLDGAPGPANLAASFHCDTEQFARDYADIDLAELRRATKLFKTLVDDLKELKGKSQKMVHRH